MHLYPEDLQRKVAIGEFDRPRRCVDHIHASRTLSGSPFPQLAPIALHAPPMNVAYAGITMDSPGSGLGSPWGGRGHLLGVRGDSAATVVPRCEVKVAVNAALQVQVSSLQVEIAALRASLPMDIAALRASLQMESAAEREDATHLFDGLLAIVLSQECSMEARVRAVDNFFDNPLRGSLRGGRSVIWGRPK
jgi:hypothetical protein